MTNSEGSLSRSPFITVVVGVCVLCLILLAAAYLRLVGLDWDENQHLHPDERFLTQVLSSMSPVTSIDEYFSTTTSTLNPNNVGFGFFVYGDFPIIVTRYIGEALNQTSYFDIYRIGRVLSAIADLLTVIFVFVIGVHLFDWRAGLIAAAIYAGAALPIQLSHFYTVDTITNMLVTASFILVVRVYKSRSWVNFILFGIVFGLAVASKINVAMIIAMLPLAIALRIVNEKGRFEAASVQPENGATASGLNRHLSAVGIATLVAGIVAVVTFRIAQPYAFLQPNSGVPFDEVSDGSLTTLLGRILEPFGMRLNPIWLNQLEEVRLQVSGFSDIPPNHQWGARLPLIFPWVNMVDFGMGWIPGVFCWLAFVWAIWEIVRRHSGWKNLLIVVLWIALYFGWQGIGWVKTMRYFLPVYPFIALLGGWALVTVWDRVQALRNERAAPRWHWSVVASTALGVLVVSTVFLWGFAVSRIYTRPVTRIAASRWVLENIPSDISLILETETGTRQFQIGLPNNYPSSQIDPVNDDQTHPLVSHSRVYPESLNSISFSLPFDGSLYEIRLNHIADVDHPDTVREVIISISSEPDGGEVVASASVRAKFASGNDARGESYTLEIPGPELAKGKTYYLNVRPDSLGPLDFQSATISTEGDWDDPMPLSLAPYNVWGAQYQGYEIHMAYEDVELKRDRLQFILDHADYLTISSNRFYASLTRNPNRFPLSIAYYRALFSGELGFDLIGDFTSRPNLGPLEFYDDDAEEAWTVYDHPRVFIFEKTARYRSQHAAAILGSVDLGKVQKVIAKDATGTPVDIPLPKLRPGDPSGLGGGTNLPIANTNFDAALMDFYLNLQPLTVVIWWLVISVIGWLAFPLLYFLLPGLADRAYPLSKITGLLLAAYFAWLVASLRLVAWGAPLALISLVAIGTCSAAITIPRKAEFWVWLGVHRRHIVFVELLTVMLFLYFVLVRLGNPDLWHPSFGGEKPMDMAYLGAVLKSTFFPPYDPWFAGGTINYYYFGFVIVGLPVRLLGIPTTLAYNLIIPTWFALTGTGAFSVAYNLVAANFDRQASSQPERASMLRGVWATISAWPRTSLGEVTTAIRARLSAEPPQILRAYVAGLSALVLAVVLGNMDEIRTSLWGLAELGSGSPQWAITLLPPLEDVWNGMTDVAKGAELPVGLGDWYWTATRLIPSPISDTGRQMEQGAITEFPYFTFLYADLHAHMIAMPLTLLALVWCVGVARAGGVDVGNSPRIQRVLHRAALITFGGIVIGALRPTNTWDWPTYLLIGGGALALAHFHSRGDDDALPALLIGVFSAVLFAGSVYLFLVQTDASDTSAGNIFLPAAVLAALIGLIIGYVIGLRLTITAGQTSSQKDIIHYLVTLAVALLMGALLVTLSTIPFIPYILTYHQGYTSFNLWEGSRTPLWAYLDIVGLFIFLVASWLAIECWRWLQEIRVQSKLERSHILPAVAGVALTVGITYTIAMAGYQIAIVVIPLIVLSSVLITRKDQSVEKRGALLFFSAALGLSLLVEAVVLAGDISRMNTVFKFYLQIWLLMAVVGGAAVGWTLPELLLSHRPLRRVWSAVLIILVFLAALYPLLATRAKIEDRWASNVPVSLDGMAYMPYVQRFENGAIFGLGPDYEALRWLQRNVQGTPVVLEAHTVEYNWGSRVTVYTGLPAIIGWNWHQRQQRGEQSDEVWLRVADVETIYNTTDSAQTLKLLETYRVKLIIVGDLERAYYRPEGLFKFDTMAQDGTLEILYRRNNTTIYQVIDK